MPASDHAGAGMRRHFLPRNGAAESFVSFIPLFGGHLALLGTESFNDLPLAGWN